MTALDRDELDLEGVPDQHLVEQRRPAGMIVRVDEAGDDGHPLRVERPGPLARERAHVGARAEGGEPRAGNRERLDARQRSVDRVDLRVEDDEVGIDGGEGRERPREEAGGARRGDPHEFPA
jgi:hypothetical protein